MMQLKSITSAGDMEMPKVIATSIIALSCLFITACDEHKSIDQSNICIYKTDDDAQKNCKEGELSYFQPDVWGNAQLPLNAASAYCDFNYPLIHTEAGVVCVFTKKRIAKLLGKS